MLSLYFAGEYEFRCNKCRKAIMQNLHKACNSIENERIDGPHVFLKNVLYGFVCGRPKCNYIQLSKANLEAHLENQHHIIASDENIIEITLLCMPHSEDVVQMSNDQNVKRSNVIPEITSSVMSVDETIEISDDDVDLFVGNPLVESNEMPVPNIVASSDSIGVSWKKSLRKMTHINSVGHSDQLRKLILQASNVPLGSASIDSVSTTIANRANVAKSKELPHHRMTRAG